MNFPFPDRAIPAQTVTEQQKGCPMSIEDYRALTLRLYATINEVFRTANTALLDPLLAPDDDLGLLQQLGLFPGSADTVPSA